MTAARADLLQRLLRTRYAIERLAASPAALVLPAHVRALIADAVQLLNDCAEHLTGKE